MVKVSRGIGRSPYSARTRSNRKKAAFFTQPVANRGNTSLTALLHVKEDRTKEEGKDPGLYEKLTSAVSGIKNALSNLHTLSEVWQENGEGEEGANTSEGQEAEESYSIIGEQLENQMGNQDNPFSGRLIGRQQYAQEKEKSLMQVEKLVQSANQNLSNAELSKLDDFLRGQKEIAERELDTLKTREKEQNSVARE